MRIMLCAFLAVVSAFAFEVKQSFYEDGANNYLITYKESSSYILDHIVVPEGSLQFLKRRTYFQSLKSLETYKEKKYPVELRKYQKLFNSPAVTTELPGRSIWPIENQWSQTWELKYSQWIDQEFNKNFFIKYNLPTDCADVAFALRWIFARNNRLPAANTLAGSNIIFSQDSFKKEWSQLKTHKKWFKDELFRAALSYLMLHVYTGTLNIDGYPIELNRDSFLVGTIHLDGGHTMIISKIDYNSELSAPIWKLSSTVPAQVRELHEELMVDQNMTSSHSGGLFRMRWPVLVSGKWALIPKDQMPLYSMEQYSDEFMGEETNFTIALIKRLKIEFVPKKIISETVNSIKKSLEQRISVVHKGYLFCKTNDCSEGGLNYEEYSTPTRDHRIFQLFITAENLAYQLRSFDPSLVLFLEEALNKTNFSVLGKIRSLKFYKDHLKYALLSYHPDDSLEQRWALSNKSMLELIQKRLDRKLTLRKLAVDDSSSCTYLVCQEGSKAFDTYNSFKLDNLLKTQIYLAYLYINQNYKLKLDNSLHEQVMKIPFYLSTPYLPYRWGEQQIDPLEHFTLMGHHIAQLSENIFWVDGVLVNINDKMAKIKINVGHNSLYLEREQLIISSKDKSLLLIDLNGEVKSKLELAYKINTVYMIGPKHISVVAKDMTNRTTIYAINEGTFHKVNDELTSSTWERDDNNDQYRLTLISPDYNAPIFDSISRSFIYEVNGELNYLKTENHLESILISDNSLVYQIDKKTLGILNLKTNLKCEYKTNFEFNQIANFGLSNLIILMSDNFDKSSLYSIKNCKLEKIKDFKDYITIQKTEELVIIQNWISDQSVYYTYHNKKLRKIDIEKVDTLYEAQGFNLYFARWTDQGVVLNLKVNGLSNLTEEINKFELPSFCKKPVNESNSVCQSNSKTVAYNFYQRDGSEFLLNTKYSKSGAVFMDSRTKISTTARGYIPRKLQVKDYSYYRMLEDTYLFMKH